MAAVPFDTLKLARRLEAAGFPGKQAGDTAEALAEAMSGAELATKSYLAMIRADLDALRAEFKAEIAALKMEIELVRRDVTIRFGSMMVVAVGVLIGAMKYFSIGH